MLRRAAAANTPPPSGPPNRLFVVPPPAPTPTPPGGGPARPPHTHLGPVPQPILGLNLLQLAGQHLRGMRARYHELAPVLRRITMRRPHCIPTALPCNTAASEAPARLWCRRPPLVHPAPVHPSPPRRPPASPSRWTGRARRRPPSPPRPPPPSRLPWPPLGCRPGSPCPPARRSRRRARRTRSRQTCSPAQRR